tara:strand:- start:535 stop:762 length:228 start_codon:yes stop_codon:yes gene_type:complete
MALNDRTKVGSGGLHSGISLDTHAVDANALHVSGIATATEFHGTFSGDGSALTNVTVTGQVGISTALVIAYATAL